MQKLGLTETKNSECYSTMAEPVNNRTMRSYYNSKQQSIRTVFEVDEVEAIFLGISGGVGRLAVQYPIGSFFQDSF